MLYNFLHKAVVTIKMRFISESIYSCNFFSWFVKSQSMIVLSFLSISQRKTTKVIPPDSNDIFYVTTALHKMSFRTDVWIEIYSYFYRDLTFMYSSDD